MQQRERSIREITTTLQKCIAQHYVKELAKLLKIDQPDAELEQSEEEEEHHKHEDHSHQHHTTEKKQKKQRARSASARKQKTTIDVKDVEFEQIIDDTGFNESQSEEETEKRTKDKNANISVGDSMARKKIYQDSSDMINRVLYKNVNDLTEKEKVIRDHYKSDDRQKYKLMKSLANITPHDKVIETRQKNGQMRYGDIICLSYTEKIQECGDKSTIFRSLISSDGVTDQGLKVLPYWSCSNQTALNHLKQCLFRIEIQQNCTFHMRETKLLQQKKESENRLIQLVQKSGREGPDQQQQDAIKKEIDLIGKDLEETKKKRIIADENNTYEQKYRNGNKITFGKPIQFRHLFSGKFLNLQIDQVSIDPGQNIINLSEVSMSCWFIFEPSSSVENSAGLVLNLNDYFLIRSYDQKTPFYLHVRSNTDGKKNSDEATIVNASSEPSVLKAKLFISYDEEVLQDKQFICNGDCIRLKQLDSEAFLTTSHKNVDNLLPTEPDFLKGQIRRMYLGQKIERQKGGMDLVEVHGIEKQYQVNDQGFELETVNMDYVNRLKSRDKENIYLEPDTEQLMFTNSCWEIQRSNPLHGGSVSSNELIKLKHIGTGKFLALANDCRNIELCHDSNSLSCLFYLRSPTSNTKTNVFVPIGEQDELTIENCSFINHGSNILLQPFLIDKYLQVMEEEQPILDGNDVCKGSEYSKSYGSQSLSQKSSDKGEDQEDEKLKVIASDYLKQTRNKMIFVVEEVAQEESIFSYQGSIIFDKLHEFYCFLNMWAVSKIGSDDKVESYFYYQDSAVENQDALAKKASQIEFILMNVNKLLESIQFDLDKSEKCKTELAEQGFLEIMLRVMQLSYFKSVPPPLFEKPFKSTADFFVEEELKSNKREQLGIVDMKTFRMDQYVPQDLARERLNQMVLHALKICLYLLRDHQGNCELATKYQSVFYQQYTSHQKYFLLQANPYFFSMTCPKSEFLFLIEQIFVRMMKNSQLVHEYVNKEINGESPPYTFIDKTTDSYTVQRWLDVLAPVKYINKENQNLNKQIMIMDVLSNFCRSFQEGGVYPYQVQIREYILNNKDNIPIKFGSGIFKNVLRPFVYLERPRDKMTLKQFLDNNPLLSDSNNFRIDQKGAIEYEMTLDLHELTKNSDKDGSESKPYIDYICSCIRLLLACSKGGRFTDTKDRLEEIGLDEEHILLSISPDAEKLIIHEQIKQIYIQVCELFYIDIDIKSDIIMNQNRCYIWDECIETDPSIMENIDYFQIEKAVKKINNTGRPEDPIKHNFSDDLAKRKLTQMHNPNDRMVQLETNKIPRDLKMLRTIKNNIIWFLFYGPSGSDSFFSDYKNKIFVQTSIKLKVKSLKVYLEIVINILKQDLVEPKFIENVKVICQNAMMGLLHQNDEEEKEVAQNIKTNWLYILMWIAKDICIKSPDNWKVENALTHLGCQIFEIFHLISFYRLNLQIEQYVIKFRKFEENQLHKENSVAITDEKDMKGDFEDLFQIQQDAIKFKLTEIYNQQMQQAPLEAELQRMQLKRNRKQKSKILDKDQALVEMMSKKIPLDQISLNIIVSPLTNIQIKHKALGVLIRNLNQREIMVKELSKTEIIVTRSDYELHLKFFENLRILELNLDGMNLDEKYNRIIKIPQIRTRGYKQKVIDILREMIKEMKQHEPFTLRKLQNLLKQSGLIEVLLNKTMKQLVNKEVYYKELFQVSIDFFHQVCLNNSNVQEILLPNLNYFLDLMNLRITTEQLISEIIKSNASQQQRKDFAGYLIKKIVNQGYFRSNLINYLTNLAQGNNPEGSDKNANQEENSNQQFIMKQIIGSTQFRRLLYMSKSTNSIKLGMIKTYVKKKQLYKQIGKEEDHELLQDKEALDLHIAVVDLMAVCAKNSVYGISQIQELIELDELLDSLISDAIPYIVKSHYFNLLFEVYLRKVIGQDDSQRLQISDNKFVQMLKYTIYFTLDEGYHHFLGLFFEEKHFENQPEKRHKLVHILDQVGTTMTKLKEERFLSGKDQEREREKEQKELLLASKNQSPYFFLDASNVSEFWHSLNRLDPNTNQSLGFFVFLESFYQQYSLQEMEDGFLSEITCKIRESLLQLAYQVFNYEDNWDDYMQPNIQEMLFQLNLAVQVIPDRSFFKTKDDQEEVDEEEGKGADDVNNRMGREKIIHIIRDFILMENIAIKEAIGLNEDYEGKRASLDELKEAIKKLTGPQASYHDIKKALDFYHNITDEKEKKRKEEMADAGTEESDGEETDQMLYIVDFEAAIHQSLNKERQKRLGSALDSNQDYDENQFEKCDIAISISSDFKLFTQRFYELVVDQNNFVEVHEYVNMLMKQDTMNLDHFDQKVSFIQNLLNGFLGLEGDDDELVLISILNLILIRNMPENEPRHVSLAELKEFQNVQSELESQLIEWQNVMFESGVPQFLFGITNIEQDPLLSNQAMTLLNNLLIEASQENQQKLLDLLQEDNQFFSVFYYMQQRIIESKHFVLSQLMNQAKEDFITQNIQDRNEEKKMKPKDFKNINIFMNSKFDLEIKYQQLTSSWREEEIYNFLKFLSLFCENCFEPGQLYLKSQLTDTGSESIGLSITSVDLIYQTVQLIIELSDSLGQYLFSEYRTTKLIPAILDTFIEFLYGPCKENQYFLGCNKKLITVFNDFIVHSDLGNFNPNHQQSRSRLTIIYKISKVMFAIVDIQDKTEAKRVHETLLSELNIQNIVNLFVGIFADKIGGNDQMRYIYEFNHECNHYRNPNYKCIENEFCELGYLLPADYETIEAGFNFYQTLQILIQTNPDHEKLKCFKRDENEYVKLKQNDAEHLNYIEEKHTKTSQIEIKNFQMWKKLGIKVLDEVIIKTFPETFIIFVEKTASEIKDEVQSLQLLDLMNQAKKTKNPIDKQQILNKIRVLIREVILTNDGEQNNSHNNAGQNQETEEPANTPKKVHHGKKGEALIVRHQEPEMVEDQEEQLHNEKQAKRLLYYHASNFYEDNLGTVELESAAGELVAVQFQVSSFFKHLTKQTQEQLPFVLNQVSQQEKLEAYVSQTPLLICEMKWQQRLGQISINLKNFANQWNSLSWVNFYVICCINTLMIYNMQVDPNNPETIRFDSVPANIANQWVGLMQTFIAAIVVLSYYIEYRALLKCKIQMSQSFQICQVPDYGENKGSIGYGNQMSGKSQVQQKYQQGKFIKHVVYSKSSTIKILYLIQKELSTFYSSLSHDRNHVRNIIFFLASVYTNTPDGILFYCLLLIDIVNKIKILTQVFSIFSEISQALVSTLALFLVLLYIYAFIGFKYFRSYFGAGNCETLTDCLVSTIDMGLRSGGGIGDVLERPVRGSGLWTGMYLYNFSFFMVINIVLMNIFFGIIIDSFAEKRAKDAEIQEEVEGQCFICGIQKSTFEIENSPWNQHIYTAHNMHSYMAFIISVNQKNKSDCSGIEKHVKKSLEEGVIIFFPINRCMSINDGNPID